MCLLRFFVFRALVALCAVLCCEAGHAQLSVSYSAVGIQQIVYSGVVLEDTRKFPADAFHIWHMKVTDLQGNILTGPADGWGENSTGKIWDANAHAWTYQFAWGSIRTQYIQAGNTLNLVVTETNRANSGAVLSGASIYPLALHFPGLPPGFTNVSYPQIAFNTSGPSALLADFGAGEVASIVPDATKPLYSGFWPVGGSNPVYSALISSTTPDGLATFQPHNDRLVRPGRTDTFTVSLRFAPSGTPLATLATDAYASWSATWPAQLKWADKRVIGTSYLASSPLSGDATQPGGFPGNPRRYFNDSNTNDFDIRTPLGLSRFQNLILQRARSVVSNLQRLNAQGVITWDLEGEEYPQATSYVCSPDQVAVEAPEMESVITDTTSAYSGMKLDDAFFKTISSAGFRVGVCIRPQQFTKAANGTAQQTYLSDSAAEASMLKKIRYAHDRWGATLFYIDSTVEPSGMALDASIFQRLAAAFPDSLLIPEESTPKHYAYTAPFKTFIFHQDLGTDPSVYAYYPHAFSCNLINDVDPSTLAAYTPQLTASVAAGDILMAHADYWQANNPAIVAIYQNAGKAAPVITPPPVVTAPPVTSPPVSPVPTSRIAIQSPSPGDTISGSVQVVASVATSLDAAGSYLMVDGLQIGTARITSSPFTYPLNTTTLAPGQHTLQVWGHSTGNDTLLSNTVSVVVANTVGSGPSPTPLPVTPVTPPNPAPVTNAGPIAITNPVNGQAIRGAITVAAAITPQLDAAGSYLMVDGQQYGYQRVGGAPYMYTLDTASLSSGSHSLQVWAHTTNNDTLLSTPVSISVVH